MNQYKSIALALLVIIQVTLSTQYYSDLPMEMTFEQSDFFFSPSFRNPLGLANFGTASV